MKVPPPIPTAESTGPTTPGPVQHHTQDPPSPGRPTPSDLAGPGPVQPFGVYVLTEPELNRVIAASTAALRRKLRVARTLAYKQRVRAEFWRARARQARA